MDINIRKNGSEVTLEVSGRLDTTTTPSLEKTLVEEVAATDALTLDFAKLEYISSAGLRVLLGAQKKMQKEGSMKLVGVCEEVMEVFEMTGFADILTIE